LRSLWHESIEQNVAGDRVSYVRHLDCGS
jgi:hypothetical protein